MTVRLADTEVTVTEGKKFFQTETQQGLHRLSPFVTLSLCTPQVSEEIGKDGRYSVS